MSNKPQSHFFAYLARMKYIHRWGLMRNTRVENVQEHSLQVAMIAHGLAVIGNTLFGENNDIGQIALVSLYHDTSEIITGDLPTPIKYFDPAITDAYKALERRAEQQLTRLLPEPLQAAFAKVIETNQIDAAVLKVVKAADLLAGYLKCIEEEHAGNTEFRRAKEYLAKKLDAMEKELPAVRYFRDHFVDSFKLTLDDLSHH